MRKTFSMSSLWTGFAFLTILLGGFFLSDISRKASASTKETLQNDLHRKFREFSVVQVNQTSFRRDSVEAVVAFELDGANLSFKLAPRDLRAPNYRAEVTNNEGRIAVPTDAEVKTFQGTIEGEADSFARLTLDGDRIEGYFSRSADELKFIEPAVKYSSEAKPNEFVIYDKNAVIETLDLHGDASLADELDAQMKSAAARVADENLSTVEYKVLELATEADKSFVDELGSVSAANQQILTVLNLVEGLYQRELRLTLGVTYQHAWTTADPYVSAPTSNDMLVAFKDYWNANFSYSQYPRDTAHLWTSRRIGGGIAYIGAVCRIPNFAYGVTGYTSLDLFNFLIPAHEIGHNLGGNHVSGNPCGTTVMTGYIDPSVVATFCDTSRTEILTFVAANNSCLSTRIVTKTKGDFDGDGKTDIAVFRPSNGVWYRVNSSSNGFIATQFGSSEDKPLSGDFDGDGRADIAVFRPSNGVWYRLNSSNNAFNAVQFGSSEDKPVSGDFDGDGKTDIAVFRPSNGVWYRLNSSNGSFAATQFGSSEDKPIGGDFDGDGRADIAVFRPSNGVWYRLNSSNGSFAAQQFGAESDAPLANVY